MNLNPELINHRAGREAGKARQVKAGMMSELLTGKIRLV
jgi:hypothetical protein